MNVRRWAASTLVAALALAASAGGCSGARAPAPGQLAGETLSGAPVHSEIDGLERASFLTSHTANDFLPQPSPDGRQLLYVSERDGQKDLFVKPLGGGVGRGSIQVTFHAADDGDPCWSPDGERIGFSSQREDPDGDIYVVRLPPVPGLAELVGERAVWQRAGMLTRLTDGMTADRQPAWSPDGDSIVYTSRWKNESLENLWILDPTKPAWRWRLTWAGGHDAVWTPDGQWVIYAAARGSDPADTDLWAIRPSDGAERQLTSGPALDASPAVSADGLHVVYARFATDTNDDGRIGTDDDASIARLDLDTSRLAELTETSLPTPIPLTPDDYFDAFPRVVGSRVVMASDRLAVRGRNLDVVEIPLAGLVREEASAAEQLRLARALDARPGLDPRVRILGYAKVLRPFAAGSAASADDLDEARERIGELELLAGQRREAVRAFEALVASAAPGAIARARAEVELVKIRREDAEDDLSAPAQRHALDERLDAGLATLAEIDRRFPGTLEIQVRAAIERGRHHLSRGIRGAALDDFRAAEAAAQTFPALAAEAAFERGRVYQSVSDTQGLVGSDVNLLTRYRDVAPWAERAADRAIAAVLGDATVLEPAQRLARLVDLAAERKAVPVLPARALLEVGRAHAEAGRPERAQEVYRRVPAEFPEDRAQVAEARFRLASLAYAAGRWDEALEQYRLIQRDVPQAERAYELARESFVRAAVEKGEAEIKGRDPQSAIATFVGLVKYDPSVVEAHRGLVDAYVRARRLKEIQSHYEAQLEQNPSDAVAAYALGLVFTYPEALDLDAAEKWLRRSIVLDPRNAYAHQTLGFVLKARADRVEEPSLARELMDATVGSVLAKTGIRSQETERKEDLLNQALEKYQAAQALSNEAMSPGQRADLDLNLGNVYLELGNDLRAYESYRAREASGRPFAVEEQEALFHTSFSKAAHRTGHLDEAERHALAALAFWRPRKDEARIYELVDSLGLVYQEQGRRTEAVEAYRETLEISRRRGDESNAFRALMNLAVNLTFQAENGVRGADWSLLDEALARHEEALAKLGTRATRSESSTGFAVTNVNVALAGESSSAATGFDEAGFRRLFLTFVARIHRDAGNVDESVAALTAKRAQLPALEPRDAARNPGTAIDHAILLEQIGALRLAQGKPAEALGALTRSLELCEALGDVGLAGAVAGIEQLARLAGEAPASVLDDTRAAALVAHAERVRELASNATTNPERRWLVARAWNAEAEIVRAGIAREPAAPAAGSRATVAERVRSGLAAAERDAAALDRARAALDQALTVLGAPRPDDPPAIARARAISAVNRARLGLRVAADASAARAALDVALGGLRDGADDDLRWRVLAERGALRERARDDQDGATADLEAAAALVKALAPGTLEVDDAGELDALFDRLASRAVVQGRVSKALTLLDTAPAIALAHVVGAGLAPEPPRPPDAALAAAVGSPPQEEKSREREVLASVLAREPLDPGDLQARLGEGEIVLAPVTVPRSAIVRVFRLDAARLDAVEVPRTGDDAALASAVIAAGLGGRRPTALYLSPRAELVRLPWESAIPVGVPSARVLSLAHLAASLDARNVLREGRLRIAAERTPGPVAPEVTEIAGADADRERILRELPGKSIVEIATPLTGGSDPLALRPALPLGAGRLQRFTLDDLVREPARRRVALAQAIEASSLTRDAAVQVLAAAGFPSVVIAPEASTRERVVAALGEASVGEAVASARKSAPTTPLELYGAVGFDADQALAFAEERYGDLVAQAARAYREERWKDAADAFADALSLEEILDRPADRAQMLYRLTDACARAGQWQRATRYQQQSVADARKQGDPAALAQALFDLGVFRSRAEDFDGAIAALGETAALWAKLGRVADKSQALAVQGIAEESAGRYQRALETFGTALALDEVSGASEGQGRQIRRIGRIQLVRLNRYADAEASFRKAQAILESAGDVPGWIESTLEIGLARVAIGDLAGAIAQYDEGLEAARDSDEKALVAKALAYRAEAHWLSASYGEAFADIRAAEQAAEAASAPRQAFLATNLNALVRWSLNDFDAALDEAERALALAEKLGEKTDVSAVHNNLGIIHRDAGRPAAALEELDQALAVDRAIGSRWGEGYDLRNIGMTYLVMGRLDAALDSLTRAVDVSRSIGDRVNEAKALVSLGDTQLALARPADAERTFVDTATLAHELGVREVEWRALWGRGRAEREQGRFPEARASFEAAVELVESLRAALKIEEMRNGFITNKVDLYEDLIRLLLDRGEVARAFDVAERSRARGFIDLLGNQKLAPAKAASRELLAKVRALDVRVEEVRSQPAGADRDRALAAAESERKDLLTQIQLEDPALSSFVSVSPLDVAGVRALLAPDVTLLAYFVAKSEVIVWVVRNDSLDVARTPLTRAELEKRVLGFRDRIQKVEPVEAESQALYDALIRPIAARIPKDATLAIVPHGILHYLSFAALADAKDPAAPYLIQHHPIFMSASASVLAYTVKPDAGRPRGALKVLAIGNPDLGTRDFDLPFAEKEVKSLAWTYPQIDILTGAKATKEWLLAHVGEYDVIHLASHGEFDPVNPLASALKLATSSSDAAAGDLFAREVFGLDLKATMVTLSACQTGLGKVEAGDEVIGLNRAFLYAGTHSLLSSLWRVSDVSTAILVKHFYRNFVHEPRAESLRQAQLHVMSYYPHPSYWAGFVLSGDYR
ncbi:MAG: CHAT domain-containing protein [bacterium]